MQVFIKSSERESWSTTLRIIRNSYKIPKRTHILINILNATVYTITYKVAYRICIVLYTCLYNYERCRLIVLFSSKFFKCKYDTFTTVYIAQNILKLPWKIDEYINISHMKVKIIVQVYTWSIIVYPSRKRIYSTDVIYDNVYCTK